MDVTKMVKESIMEQIQNWEKDYDREKINENDYVKLYHGTSSYYLNSILQNGILPRRETGNDNFEHVSSNEVVTYLSNKWHYHYAYHANEELLRKEYGEDWSMNPKAQWWLTLNPVPVYIECKIPKQLLVLDEDIVHSRYFTNKVKQANKKGKALELTWEDCLTHYGTVGVIGAIKPEWITSFTVLADAKLYLELKDENGAYEREVSAWFKGKGKGKLKKQDLKNIEAKHQMVGTFPIDMIPNGCLVTEFGLNDRKQFTLVVNKPEEYASLFKKLEVI